MRWRATRQAPRGQQQAANMARRAAPLAPLPCPLAFRAPCIALCRKRAWLPRDFAFIFNMCHINIKSTLYLSCRRLPLLLLCSLHCAFFMPAGRTFAQLPHIMPAATLHTITSTLTFFKRRPRGSEGTASRGSAANTVPPANSGSGARSPLSPRHSSLRPAITSRPRLERRDLVRHWDRVRHCTPCRIPPQRVLPVGGLVNSSVQATPST